MGSLGVAGPESESARRKRRVRAHGGREVYFAADPAFGALLGYLPPPCGSNPVCRIPLNDTLGVLLVPEFSYNGTITLSTSVKDLDASIAWFKDVLGFEETFKVAEAGWAEVSTPAEGVSIGLEQTDGDVEGGGGSIPVFGVVDIDAARAELEGKGVEFAGETVELPGMVKLATFFDPDGNRYMFAQSLADDAS